jgi:hypothetical protein
MTIKRADGRMATLVRTSMTTLMPMVTRWAAWPRKPPVNRHRTVATHMTTLVLAIA